MSKILFGTLMAWLVTSCAMEEPDTAGVLVDPNSDTEVPEGLTARDVDFNKDGVVNILDLVIVSKLFGDVEPEEIAEACPAGEYREHLQGEVVGYNSLEVSSELVDSRYPNPVLTDDSGKRLEDKHKESCFYLYPNNGYNDSTGAVVRQFNIPKNDPNCLVTCNHDRQLLCRQKKGFSQCKTCRFSSTKFNNFKKSGTILRASEYIKSSDPTKCLYGEETNVDYLFSDGNGNNYTYVLLKVSRRNIQWVDNNRIFGCHFETNQCASIWDLDNPFEYFDIAVRLLIADQKPEELKIKILDNMEINDSSITKTVLDVSYGVSSKGMKNHLGYGIQIGNRLKENPHKTDTVIQKMTFKLGGLDYYWSVLPSNSEYKIYFEDYNIIHPVTPEKVRSKYFPEDIK